MNATVTTAEPEPIVLELFYLDLQTCDPCRSASTSVDEAVAAVREQVGATGRTVEVREVHVTSREQADRFGFVSSPTVRVNGVDLEPDVQEDGCGTCSAIVEEPIACRTYGWQGERHQSPPAAMIVDAVLRQLDGQPAAAPPVVRRTARSSVERFLAARAPVAEALRAVMRGEVLEAEDAGWDARRLAYNTAFDQRPAVIVVPADAQDVVAAIGVAKRYGMQIAAQRTGHNAEPLERLDDLILLRTDAMRDVHIDPVRLQARVGAGAKWEDVVPQASELGLAALHGSTPDVSIAGYSLGGGVGWYARSLGLSTNSVTGIEIATADGRLRWVDHQHEPELFWALRGGGGNFGVVTALEIALYEMPELYAGVLFYPFERSAEVLHAWHAWTKTVPDEMTSVGRMIQFPDVDDVPEPLRGGSFVIVEAFYRGTEEEGARLLEPFRALGPVLDTVAMVPPAGIAETHMDPPNPLPYAADHAVLDDLSDEAIDALVRAVGPGSGSELISVEIRHLDGALSRSQPHHGALDVMPGPYMLFGVGIVTDDASRTAVRTRLDDMLAATREHTRGLYFNFVEHRIDPARIWRPETYRRLLAVKRDVDPAGMFRANHSIPVTPSPTAPR